LTAASSRKTTSATALQFFEIKKNAAGAWSCIELSRSLPQKQGGNELDLPPSIFAITDAANRQMLHFPECKKSLEARIDDKQN